MNISVTIAVTCLILLKNSVSPLNILAIYPYNGKSHFLVFRVLLRELANRGHNVTVISHFPEQDPPKNYQDISLAGTLNTIEDGTYPIQTRYYAALMDGLYILNTAKKDCEVLLANKDVQDLIKKKMKFDVIVLEQFNSDCALGVTHKLGDTVVATTSNVMMPFHLDRFGIPNNPSYSYFHFLGGTKPCLIQRLERVMFNVYFKVIHYLASYSNQNTLAKYFDDIPPLEDLARDIKFLLVYHNFMLTGSNLLPANVIEVGGYHVTKAQPLTGNLKKFVDESEHGVIYISFGSLVRSSSLPIDKIKAILDAMDEFPQRFIWKWENATLGADNSKKVYFDSWLPQVDVLGQPKTLAFFSHAGMGGTTEALYFGVPIVAMPIDGDQPCNAAVIEESGLGVQLHFGDLTKENLVAAFKTVLEPKFRDKVKEVSSAWHDRPMSALDTAVFWTEFAGCHPSLSFRTRAADVPFYQDLCLDVIIVFALIILTLLWFFKLCRKYCISVKIHEEKRSQKSKKFKRM